MTFFVPEEGQMSGSPQPQRKQLPFFQADAFHYVSQRCFSLDGEVPLPTIVSTSFNWSNVMGGAGIQESGI